ncbi:MAG: transcriptional repressor [Euzebyales bacterium]|nr:transcriptional repressor [Euzebyales bacterium]MBA3621296.1 transcriptional repressor [Euzebyales bacterium]
MTDIADLLHDHGHRVTTPRRAVWRVLSDAKRHLTVEELASRVQAERSGVNIASVYRALGLFAQYGLVRESRLAGDDAGRWELAHPDDHFHVVCDHCGDVDHHVGDLVEHVRDHLTSGHGFQPDSVELTVRGRCARCLAPA